MYRNFALAMVLVIYLNQIGAADDWARFRGPEGSGVAVDSNSLPTAWSPSANLAWKTPLPGPGASSPIIVGDKAFVTCYSRLWVDPREPGRHRATCSSSCLHRCKVRKETLAKRCESIFTRGSLLRHRRNGSRIRFSHACFRRKKRFRVFWQKRSSRF